MIFLKLKCKLIFSLWGATCIVPLEDLLVPFENMVLRAEI